MIEVKFDLSQWDAKIKAIDGAARQMPFVCAYALTKAMYEAREAERAEMEKVFDRPTPYTLNSMQVTAATKHNLRAELSFKGFPRPAWKWLRPEVMGGQRRQKAFETALRAKGIMGASQFAIPGPGIRLNAYGNIPGATIVRILSQLGAAEYKAGFSANMTARSRGRAIKKAGGQYFAIKGRGVYFRTRKKVTPVLIFVSAANYSKRFHFYEAAQRIIPEAFKRHMLEGFERFVVNDIKKGGSKK